MSAIKFNANIVHWFLVTYTSVCSDLSLQFLNMVQKFYFITIFNYISFSQDTVVSEKSAQFMS